MYAAIQIMAAQKEGKPVPAHMWADENYASTCIPDEASVAQLARVVVKWLREHPEKLHELKSFVVIEALKSAFPCPVPEQEATKPLLCCNIASTSNPPASTFGACKPSKPLVPLRRLIRILKKS